MKSRGCKRSLSNNDFVAKAKEEVIQKERDKAVQFDEKLRTLRSSLEKIAEISKREGINLWISMSAHRLNG